MKRGAIIVGIIGVVIGDALGLPVQFMTKTEIRKNPITDMTGGGAFGLEPVQQPYFSPMNSSVSKLR